MLLARLQSTRVVTRPSRPNVIVYFDLTLAGTSVVSSGPWSLTSCHEVPASSLAQLDSASLACVRPELGEEMITTTTRIANLVLIEVKLFYLTYYHFAVTIPRVLVSFTPR